MASGGQQSQRQPDRDGHEWVRPVMPGELPVWSPSGHWENGYWAAGAGPCGPHAALRR
jgi:hypothetical protein